MLYNLSCPYHWKTISSQFEGRITFSNREDIIDDTITTVYCVCEEFSKAMSLQDDPQVRMTTAEVMTVPLVAAIFFVPSSEATSSTLAGFWPSTAT